MVAWVCSIHSAVCTSFAWHFIGGSLGLHHSLCGLYKLCGNFCFLTFIASKRSRLCSLIRNTLKKKAGYQNSVIASFLSGNTRRGEPQRLEDFDPERPKGYRGETQRKSRSKKVKHVIFKCVNRKRYFCNVWKLKMIFYGLFTFWYVYSYNMFNCELKISIQQIKTNFVPEELIL